MYMYMYMYLNFYMNILFIPMIFITTMMIFSSNSWFSMWMIMEINMLSFIFILVFDKFYENYNSMIYMLIQSFNSYIFLFGSMNIYFLNLNLINLFYLFMNLSLLTKLGMSPFFFWYPKIMKNMNWINFMILSTIQKIIPLYIMNLLMKLLNNFMIKLNLFNCLIFMFTINLIALNNINLRLMMCFSSMMHLNWILMLMYIDENMLIFYLNMYYLIIYVIIKILNNFNLNSLNDLFMMKFLKKEIYYMFMILFISLMSLPPMISFILKWMFFKEMLTVFNFYFLLINILMSLTFMMIYMRMLMPMILMNNMIMKINFKLYLSIINMKIYYYYLLLLFNLMYFITELI
uniref:NADH-ubiquinone oxidoreductase chain 2 n=1 Tax=Gonatocerus sp. ZCS-2018 TaxID=2305128 RepID=A0A346PZ49_9HYME|nr:NADH dehydrogenase subunit 2 [Gonatocerus sp. ZCS-2018]